MLGRRVFNLAAGRASAGRLGRRGALIGRPVARQARHLLADRTIRPAAEHAMAAASRPRPWAAGRRRQAARRRLRRLSRALPETVHPDGGHASRNPAGGAGTAVRPAGPGRGPDASAASPAPAEVSRAMDRLSRRRAVLHPGRRRTGRPSRAARRRAAPTWPLRARATTRTGDPGLPARRNGYQRLETGALQVVRRHRARRRPGPGASPPAPSRWPSRCWPAGAG